MTNRLPLALMALAFAATSAACAWDVTARDLGELAPGPDESAVIVGSIGWTDITQLSDVSDERRASRAVGYLSIPARGQRCTAFLVAPDVVMTNHHCIAAQWQAEGATVAFARETGVPYPDQQPYACDELLAADDDLDYALLRCDGRPGDEVGVLGLDASVPHAGDDIYVLHQNCDYYSDRWCDPVKRYSPGDITFVYNELQHDADTLGGSSGAPLLRSDNHLVQGLHHVGLGNNGAGRGSGNLAVPMSRIVPHIEALGLDLDLGERLPGGAGQPPEETPPEETPPEETPPTVDGEGEAFEPNEAPEDAADLAVPFAWDALAIESETDVDWFRFETAGAETRVRIEFLHAVGDLDLYIHTADGQVFAQSIGTSNVEEIEQAFPAGRYRVRVTGYAGATGAYNLRVE